MSSPTFPFCRNRHKKGKWNRQQGDVDTADASTLVEEQDRNIFISCVLLVSYRSLILAPDHRDWPWLTSRINRSHFRSEGQLASSGNALAAAFTLDLASEITHKGVEFRAFQLFQVKIS